MSHLDRRDLLKLGAGGLAGLTLGGSSQSLLASDLAPATDTSRIVSSREAFEVGPGLIRRLDSTTNRVMNEGIWGLPAASSYLAPTLAAPLSFTMEELQAWADARSGKNSASPADLSVRAVHDVLSAPLVGGLDLTELSTQNVLSLREHGGVDLSLDFAELTGVENFNSGEASGIPIFNSVSQPSGLGSMTDAVIVPVTAFGWRVQLRGPDNHPFGSCTPRGVPVKHFNLEIFRHLGGGRYQAVKNFHLGTYRFGGRRCFVLYQNVRPGIICLNDCTPTLGELATMIAFAVAVAALIAVVVISSSTLSAIATTSAAAFFGVLLLAA